MINLKMHCNAFQYDVSHIVLCVYLCVCVCLSSVCVLVCVGACPCLRVRGVRESVCVSECVCVLRVSVWSVRNDRFVKF